MSTITFVSDFYNWKMNDDDWIVQGPNTNPEVGTVLESSIESLMIPWRYWGRLIKITNKE